MGSDSYLIGREFEDEVARFLEENNVEYYRPTTYHRGRPIGGNSAWPDFFIFGHGEMFFIECKFGSGKLRKDQREKKEMLEALGFKYFVVKKIEDVFDIFGGR